MIVIDTGETGISSNLLNRMLLKIDMYGYEVDKYTVFKKSVKFKLYIDIDVNNIKDITEVLSKMFLSSKLEKNT